MNSSFIATVVFQSNRKKPNNLMKCKPGKVKNYYRYMLLHLYSFKKSIVNSEKCCEFKKIKIIYSNMIYTVSR